jgi:hypothetical protein
MTKQQFREGQDVEVWVYPVRWGDPNQDDWRKAKIVRGAGEFYEVQFLDGTRAVFDAEHIRAVEHIGIASGQGSGDQRVRFDYGGDS